VIVPCDHPLWLGAPLDPPWPGLLANRLKLRVRLRVIPKHLAAMDAARDGPPITVPLREPEAPLPPVRGFFIVPPSNAADAFAGPALSELRDRVPAVP